MKVHLVDGTYELFRSHFGVPPASAPDGRPVGAVRGLIQTLLALLRQDDVTHVACAFDHVVESFRNEMFSGYKTGEGVPDDLMGQFSLAEEAAAALGLVVWPMTEFEADDVIATAVSLWRDRAEVEQIVICSPDKDLMQMVSGSTVVSLDRRNNIVYDEAGVIAKFGIPPDSIPDYLALVGDSADGIPGVPRWGAKTTATVLGRYGHIEQIPDHPYEWDVKVRGLQAAASNLAAHRSEARLYKQLATLRLDVPIEEDLDDLRWEGVPRRRFEELCVELGMTRLASLPHLWKGESSGKD